VGFLEQGHLRVSVSMDANLLRRIVSSITSPH
jgi:hypothetical protein